MSRVNIIVFEDEFHSGFYPISLSRPTYQILSGAKTNLERINHYFNEFDIFTICRPQLSDIYGCIKKPKLDELAGINGGIVILINGRVVLSSGDSEFISEIKECKNFVTYTKGDLLAAAVIPSKYLGEIANIIGQIFNEGGSRKIIDASKKNEKINIKSFSSIWEPMIQNPLLITSDFDEYYKDGISNESIGDSYIYNRKGIYTGPNISADAASVIDAREGPVILGTGVEIKPFCYLEGPAFIGGECKLVGGKITGGCSFGDGCRIGGEVENIIMIGNSNKYHEGFLGHAYIGEWVNLGALTTNSDLKNNYSEINVKQNGEMKETGNIKIGCFMGDHSKTGIGITLNTGITIGFSCSLFGGSLIIEKEIPSFAWGNDLIRHEYSQKKAAETARIVMQRRNHSYDERHSRLFDYIFAETRGLRKSWLGGKKH